MSQPHSGQVSAAAGAAIRHLGQVCSSGSSSLPRNRDRKPMAFLLVGESLTLGPATSPRHGLCYPSRLDQAAADRIAGELDAVAHPELAHQVLAVALDRA